MASCWASRINKPQSCACFIPVHVSMQIRAVMEHTTRVAAWTAMQDRQLLVQRWQGTKVSKLSLPNKTPRACAHRFYEFHRKVLDATMLNLPEHASSDFVVELSDLMSDHAWWDALEEKHVELLNDRARNKAGVFLPPPPPLANAYSPTANASFTPHSPQTCRPRWFSGGRGRFDANGRRSAHQPPATPFTQPP